MNFYSYNIRRVIVVHYSQILQIQYFYSILIGWFKLTEPNLRTINSTKRGIVLIMIGNVRFLYVVTSSARQAKA